MHRFWNLDHFNKYEGEKNLPGEQESFCNIAETIFEVISLELKYDFENNVIESALHLGWIHENDFFIATHLKLHYSSKVVQ